MIQFQLYELLRLVALPSTLKEQLSRAAPSIALNLAEGYGKATVKDQNRFFQIAFGSTRECQAIFALSELENTKAFRVLDALAAHIYKLIKYGG